MKKYLIQFFTGFGLCSFVAMYGCSTPKADVPPVLRNLTNGLWQAALSSTNAAERANLLGHFNDAVKFIEKNK